MDDDRQFSETSRKTTDQIERLKMELETFRKRCIELEFKVQELSEEKRELENILTENKRIVRLENERDRLEELEKQIKEKQSKVQQEEKSSHGKSTEISLSFRTRKRTS